MCENANYEPCGNCPTKITTTVRLSLIRIYRKKNKINLCQKREKQQGGMQHPFWYEALTLSAAMSIHIPISFSIR